MTGVSRVTGGPRLGQVASFSVLVFANVLLMASTSAPSPNYPLYLERWGFSVTILTVVFAVYVAGLVGALSLIATFYAARRLASRLDDSRPSRSQSPGDAPDRPRRTTAGTPLTVRAAA